MPNQPFTRLQNRYQFHAVIGQGGTGEVSAAWDTQLERTVAIKRLRVSDLREESMSATWQEAMRLAAIRHANIVAVYDLGVEDGSAYVVMEYVQGETIEQRVEATGPLGGEEFAEFARQTLEGITAAHHANLIHRDLKPANIMLARQPSGSLLVKVLDFGIARFIDAHTMPDTEAETVTGSIHCIAPEQLNREPVDIRTDLYSIGCVFYFALTGRYPFNGPKIADVIQAHLNHEVVSLDELRPDLAPELGQWVMTLLHRQPDLRPSSAQQALQHLQAIISVTSRTTPIPLPSASQPPVAASPLPAWRGWAVPARSGLVAAVVVMIGILWSRPKEAPVAAKPPAPAAVGASAPAKSMEPIVSIRPVVAEMPVVPAEPTPPPVAVAPAPVPEPPEVVLRLHGSNTIGGKLAPMLVEEYFKREGAVSVERVAGKSIEEITVVARFNSGPPRAVEIAAHGTKTAFDGLASGGCDIGLASRQAKADEVELGERSGLGDLWSPLCEHVLGLDGLAILVHPASTVKALTKKQVGEIFAGKIVDWSAVGGAPGPIRLHARDAKSGTFDTFKSVVLGSSDLAAATRYEDSNALSDAVAADPQAIGFAGLPYVRKTRALAISDDGTRPFLATRFTVAAEDYVLSRRLYLYTPVAPQNPLVAKFVEFALRPEGQEIVSRAGFVKQTIDLERPIIPAGAPAEYADSVRGAERLSVNFRFRSGKAQLDNKALRDLERLTVFLAEPANAQRGLMLFGFADQQGAEGGNVKMARERAQFIGRELETRGIKPALIAGLGSSLPVATNSDEAGRQRNRRVELWLRTPSAVPVARSTESTR